MAVYSANKPVRTVTLHKPGCRSIPYAKLKSCGCGITGNLGNQRWFCEDHVNIEEVNDFMNHRYWAILFCNNCFQND